MEVIKRIRIPTILGLAIITLGIMAGVFVVVGNQNPFQTQASPTEIPKNKIITNQTGESLTISWQTSNPVPGFVTFGTISADEQTATDDRDQGAPTPRITHHVTLTNLRPETAYQYQVFSGGKPGPVEEFTTPSNLTNQNNFKPVIGSVLMGDQALDEGIVYLTVSQGDTQSTIIRDLGNFIIPIAQMIDSNLTGIFLPDNGTIAKISVLAKAGEGSALIRLVSLEQAVGPLKIGQNMDLTVVEDTQPTSQDLTIFDLNDDKFINSADHSILLQNFGRNPQNKKADITGPQGTPDGIVDQEDLNALLTKINQFQ